MIVTIHGDVKLSRFSHMSGSDVVFSYEFNQDLNPVYTGKNVFTVFPFKN